MRSPVTALPTPGIEQETGRDARRYAWGRSRPVTARRSFIPRVAPYLFIFLPVAYVGVLLGFTLCREVWFSFTSTNLLSPSHSKFVGLANFRAILTGNGFAQVLIATAVYTVGSIVGALGLGLAAAFLMNRAFAGRSLVRSLIAVPWATPGVAVALVFTWIFNNQFGVLNFGLTRLGVLPHYTSWLDNPHLAMLSVLIPTVWQLFPVCALVILAAMQAVPKDLEEAARQDGADRLNVVRHVVWPTISPTVALIALFATIWSLRRFELLWLLTQGGPGNTTDTVAVDVYRDTFQYAQLGKGAAVGVIGLAISICVTLGYYYANRRAERAAARSGA